MSAGDNAMPAHAGRADRGGLVGPTPLVAAVFVAMLLLGALVVFLLNENREHHLRQVVLDRAEDHLHALGLQVDHSLAATQALAALVRQGKGTVDDFDSVAAGMLPRYAGISAVALAPDGVVEQIFPLAGNEGVIGIDILADPARHDEARAALASRQTVIAGPLPLRGGGQGFIARRAVFLDAPVGERFWGFVTVVLPLEQLLRAGNLSQARDAGYAYEIARVDPVSGRAVVFARSGDEPLTDPVVRRLSVTNSTWILSTAPVRGWRDLPQSVGEALIALLLSALIAWRVDSLFRQPRVLRREVERRTRELAEANGRLEREVAARAAVQDTLERRNRVLRVLSQGNGALVRADDEATLLGNIGRILTGPGGYCVVWAALLDGDGALRPVVMQPADAFDGAPLALERDVLVTGDSFVALALAWRSPVVTPDVRCEALYRPVADGVACCGCHAGIALPLVFDDHVFGVMVVHSRADAVFDEDEREVLEELACDVGYGLATLRTRRAHREAAERLAESEKRFRAISGSAQDGVVLLDDRGAIVYWNPAAERMFGYTEAEALGKPVHGLVAPREETAAVREGMAAFGASGAGPVVGRLLELEARRRDGTVFPVELSVSSLQLGGRWHAVGIVRDISFRRQSEEALRVRDRALEASGDGIMISSADLADNPFTYVNPGFERITGYSAAEAVGRNGRFLLGGDLHQIGLDEIRLALREGRDGRAELRNFRKDGSEFWIDLSVSPVRNREGRVSHFVSVMHDVTERKRYEEQLEHQATHDGLTGLPNRNLFADRLEQAIAQAAREGGEVAVMAVDLDNFRVVNDGLGHAAADLVLKVVGGRLLACVRDGDTVARAGSDEFVVVLPGVDADRAAHIVQERIQAELGRPIAVAGQEQELVVTSSTGISMYPRDGTDRATLLKSAYAAMHEVKAAGRHGFRFFTAEMNRRVGTRLALEGELRRALSAGELVLHYQPQVDLTSGHVTGAEALVRWQHPQRGLLGPAEFIPLAEENGLIVPMGEWILREACRQNRAWHDAGLPAGRIAVNLSARQFAEGDLVNVTREVLAQTRVPASQLELELTESMAMQDVEKVIGVLRELRALGVQTALDDFGTGYSSLSYLQLFALSGLKIDRSFVREVEAHPGNAVIVATIIAMARSLGLRVIAEGVESAAELAWLRTNRCDEIQGFHFSRPLPADAYAVLLAERRSLAPAVAAGDASARTLLLVDDEPNVLSSLRRLLRTEGYRILTANSAREGLELLALNPVQVILSDQRMPEMTGTEFFLRVKQLHPDTVRIILSGYTELKSVTEAINQGAIYKFLTKPWDDAALRETIREAFRMHEDARRPGLLSPV